MEMDREKFCFALRVNSKIDKGYNKVVSIILFLIIVEN